METSKEELLALLMKECELYSTIPASEQQPKFKDIDEQLSIPTYVRNKVEIQL